MSQRPLNDRVRHYWEGEPCGTGSTIAGETPPLSKEWFEKIEAHRYRVEPFIHEVAQFRRYHAKTILEVGVGAGTDHLQFARAGARCYGVDITDAAIETTRARLAMYGLHSELQRVDAESLPFQRDFFDAVYSWGVIHHADRPEKIIREIHRVLKPNGVFIGMLYGRRSLVALRLWLRHGLAAGKPWRTFSNLIWHHMESIGTKAYTIPELRELFSGYSRFEARPILTVYDVGRLPPWVSARLPNGLGWFIAMEATK